MIRKSITNMFAFCILAIPIISSADDIELLVDKLNWGKTVDDLKSGLLQTNGLLLVTYVLLGISLLGILVGEILRLVRN